jgi:hypothetical protein
MAGSPPTPRTTADLVKGIIQVQVGVDVTPFIATANELTTDVCTYTVDQDGNPIAYTDGYVGSRMELIERWLAAHFYTIFDNQLSAARAGTVAVGYQLKVDFGLKNSMYGQQAMMLDTNGGLAKYDNSLKVKRKIKVSLGWLGCHRRFLGEEGDPIWSDLTVVQ